MDDHGNEQQPPAPTPSEAPKSPTQPDGSQPIQTPPAAQTPPPVSPSVPAFVPTPSISGSQIAADDADAQHKRAARRLVIVGIVVAIIAVVLIVVALVFGSNIGSYLNSPLVNTNYSNAGVNYELKFYNHSTQQLSNSLPWMTQGGRKPLSTNATVLTSPALGKYGTGLALFMVPVPADKVPLLPKSSCSDLPGLSQVFSVSMQQDGSTAVVCGQTSNGKNQVEYLFQFHQRNLTYVGFVLMEYDWNQVTSSATTAKAFLAYANLSKYNSEIKTIVSSIQVQ